MRLKIYTSPRTILLVGLATFFSFYPYPTSKSNAFDTANSSSIVNTAGIAQMNVAYGKLPLRFEENKGQTDSPVKFLSRGPGYALFLTQTEAVMALQTADDKRDVLRMKPVGANPNATVTGVGELSGKSNYFVGSDPSKWQTNVPNFARVKYEEVYPGIDVAYYGNQQQLEYDFIVAAGANPELISLEFSGAQSLSINEAGELVITTANGEIRQHTPITYQKIDGVKKTISSSYIIKDGTVGFSVGNYDSSQPLVIDPVLGYSTYLGGSKTDVGLGIGVDSAGNAYVTGYTASPDFPIQNAYQPAQNSDNYEAFITKLTSTGALGYSTYLGGTLNDYSNAIAVDASGNAYITGYTTSSNFPTLNAYQASYGGGFSDAFVAKLTPNGALDYSTYLGGNDYESGQGITADSGGNIYTNGQTYSTNFPTLNAFQTSHAADSGNTDVYITKITASGVLSYSTYLGGDNLDWARSIKLDSGGNAYLTGYTLSSNFPTLNAYQASSGGNYDAFIVKLTPSGALDYSTYFGGSNSDVGNHIALDSLGNIFVTGASFSTNFPTLNPVQASHAADNGNADVIIFKFTASWVLDYSTYLGGSGYDSGEGIGVDAAGNAYVGGNTASSNFPILNAYQATSGGGTDVLLTKLTPSGALDFSTFFGGNSGDEAFGIAVESTGNIYLTGGTTSINLPTFNAFQPSKSDGTDSFVTKFVFNQPPAVAADNPSVSVGEGSPASNTGTYSDNNTGDNVTITASVGTITKTGTNIGTWSWSFGTTDGPTQSQTVTITASDGNGGTAQVMFSLTVNNVAPTAAFSNTSGTINEDTSATLAFSSQSDPSSADTTAGFLYSYDCTNDGTFEVTDSTSAVYSGCSYPNPGSFTARGRIKDKDGGFTDYTATVLVNDIPTLDDFILLGKEGVWLKAGVVVNNGDIGANIASPGPFLDSGVEVSIGNNALITDSTSAIFGDDIKIKTGSQVRDVHYNAISGPGTILGSSFTPLALPLLTFPTVPSFTPGTTDVTIPINASQGLSPGNYDELLVNHDATLTFTGGTYTFNSWDIRQDANLYFAASTEIMIAGRVDAALRVEIRPAVGSGIDASNIKIIVTGINGNTGNLGAAPKAAEFGANSIIEANMYVPNGTLWLKDNITATGAFLGKWIIAGQDALLTHRTAF